MINNVLTLNYDNDINQQTTHNNRNCKSYFKTVVLRTKRQYIQY